MTFCKEDKGREIIRWSYPFPLMSNGERKKKNMKKGGEHEDKGRNGHRGSMSIAINAKWGDCWKIGFIDVNYRRSLEASRSNGYI
jgi:hypothetical protein